MKIIDLQEAVSAKPSGTYAAVKFSKKSEDIIHQFCLENSIPHALNPSKYHITLLYSKKYLPDYKPYGEYQVHIEGIPDRFDIWETSEADKKDHTYALVLKVKSPKLVERHKHLMKKYDAIFDYPEYQPHITLSYNVGKDFDLKTLQSKVKDIGEIEIVSEYGEDLKQDWAKSAHK